MLPEEIRKLFIIFYLPFILVNCIVFIPEIIKFIRLFKSRCEYKKQCIEKMMANNPPPRATFFGRIDGKYISVEGPYEEQYLPRWKRRRWELNKKKIMKITSKKDKNE